MTTYTGGRNDSLRGQVCSITMGEKVGTWNVFRWGGGATRDVPVAELPADAMAWLDRRSRT